MITFDMDPAWSSRAHYLIDSQMSIDQIEYESSGITIQTLCPSYICTSMTAFSDNLSQPSFFVPSPDCFAASAIRTLGTVYILGQ